MAMDQESELGRTIAHERKFHHLSRIKLEQSDQNSPRTLKLGHNEPNHLDELVRQFVTSKTSLIRADADKDSELWRVLYHQHIDNASDVQTLFAILKDLQIRRSTIHF